MPETTAEVLESRQPFLRPATLEELLIICGDDRIALDLDSFLQQFGGVLNTAMNLAVVQEAKSPNSVTDSLQDRAEEVTRKYVQVGLKPGVHSSTETETGDTIDLSNEHDIDCGYAGKRKPISLGIADKQQDLPGQVRAIDPARLKTQKQFAFAEDIVAANGRLAERPGFLTSGFGLLKSAIEAGARGVLVDGKHQAEVGLIIRRPNTRFDVKAALDAGLPAYVHEQWVALAAFDKIGNGYPFTRDEFDIATTIDTIGTMRALGVKTIAVIE